MRVEAIRTHKITAQDRDLFAILDRYLPSCSAGSVLAITSKVVAICQGRLIPAAAVDKQALIEAESDLYLPPSASRYQVTLTVKDGLLIPSAGIDESNSDGCFVLWPQDAQLVANQIRRYLCRRFDLEQVGVILTDSRTSPLRWGVTGVAIAHSGFDALHDYIGQPDLFGRPLRMTKGNVMDGLAAAAVLVMGEGDEQTPLALLSHLPFVTFRAEDPSPDELDQLRIELADDLYAPLLHAVTWLPGHPLPDPPQPSQSDTDATPCDHG